LNARRPPIRFEDFEVDPASGELRKGGLKIRLQEQPFQALAALIEHAGEVVTREELQKRLWPEDTVVDFDRGLNKAINRVREALGDDADNPRYIETLPQRGYRFLVRVKGDAGESALSELEQHASANLPYRLLGRRSLFGIGGGFGIVLIMVLGYSLLRPASTRIESIAVLPLENLSGSTAHEYFSDGMTDALIGEISRIGSLRVISRTSILRYKGGAHKSLPDIARELNVDAILEGTVTQSGQKVRITAQLIRARDDRHLWSSAYERNLADVLSLQAEVARTIASQIEIKLTPLEMTRLNRAARVKPEAYEAFLKGNFFLHKAMPGIAKSIESFKQAIELDPSFADAHAGLAEALCFAGIFGLDTPANIYTAARASAVRALQLDETNASAHNALANIKEQYDWDLTGAEVEYRRALQLNPSHLLARIWYAQQLDRRGRSEAATEELARALKLDPISPMSLTARSMLFFRARRYDEAIQASQQALDLEPNWINALWWQGLSYAGKGDFPNAIASLTKGARMNDGSLFRSLLGHVYGRAGDRANALAMLQEIRAQAKHRYVSPIEFAVVYAGLGDADSAFDSLENAYRTRVARVGELPFMYYDSLRADARYPDLMRRVSLSH
jgi:TolB-like protein/DNA-binding winged helix-turn-helix (wHTH) protein/Tfp pilus assembly protein PilF